MEEAGSVEAAAPAKRSAGMKWALGCGLGCLVVLVIIGAVVAGSAFYVKKQLGNVEVAAQEFEARGFVRTGSKMMPLEVRENLDQPTVCIGQVVSFHSVSKSDLAICAMVAELHGQVKGNAFFRGQVLSVGPEAVIEGNLDAECKMLQVMPGATIKGQITGEHALADVPKAE